MNRDLIENPNNYDEFYRTLTTIFITEIDEDRIPVIRDFWDYKDQIINGIINDQIDIGHDALILSIRRVTKGRGYGAKLIALVLFILSIVAVFFNLIVAGFLIIASVIFYITYKYQKQKENLKIQNDIYDNLISGNFQYGYYLLVSYYLIGGLSLRKKTNDSYYQIYTRNESPKNLITETVAHQITAEDNMTEEQIEAYDVGMLQCMLTMAMADGVVDENEIKAIASIYEGVWNKTADKNEIRRIADEMANKGFNDVFKMEGIHDFYNIEMRKDIIKAGYLVARADGVLSQSEKDRLGEIANAIQITGAQIKEAIDEVKSLS